MKPSIAELGKMIERGEQVEMDPAGNVQTKGDAFTLLDEIFEYHAPSAEQLNQYRNIRAAARVFAQALLDNAPASADRTAALRKIREAVMTANAAVALKGRI